MGGDAAVIVHFATEGMLLRERCLERALDLFRTDGTMSATMSASQINQAFKLAERMVRFIEQGGDV